MSSTPNKRLHENGGNGSGNASHDQSSASKYSHDDQGTKSGNSGKVVAPIRHGHHSPYEMGQDSRIPKIVARNDSRDEERRSPLLPNMMFRVSTSNDAHSDHIGSKDSIKVDNRDLKSDSRDDTRDGKHERDSYSEHKSEKKLDKDVYSGSNSQFGRKDMKEHQRSKQNSEGPGGNVDTWHTSRTILQGPTEAVKEGLHSDIRDHSESARENKVDMKGDDKLREKERKGKEMKHRDWAERDKERSDPRNNSLVGGGGSGENKEVQRESEKGGFEKKDPVKDKEKLHEKEKVHTKRESDKDTMQNEKELVGVPGKSAELEISMLDLKKKDHDKNAEREARDKKKERDVDVESERPDKRGRFHEKEPEDCGMESEGGVEREIETFNSGVQQRKRMLRPRGSPQRGNRDLRIRPHSNDNEGSQGQADASCVVYKNGECMQELIKLWKKQEQSLADEACESLPNGPTLEIRIPAEHVTATNRQVRGGQLWGTDVYTVDSDLVAVLTHTGYYRPTASPPPPNTQELRATIRVLPPQDGYVSTWRNNVRSRAWGAAVGCSYCVERCCIVKKGGGIVEIEPCLTHSSTMEPTLAPVAVECTMTTRAAATNALRKRRFVREVTIQFNLCNEPWIKYSISAVADKGLKRPLFTSARLKKGEVLYLESRFCRYELCFSGEKVHANNGERMNIDSENNNVVDVFRWSRLKRPIPCTLMPIFGIPLPPEKVKVLEDELEWDNISWSQTGVWIAGREYHLSRTLFLSAN